MSAGAGAIDRTIATLTQRLLAYQTSSGSWEGRLSNSALSTATAVLALSLHKGSHEALIDSGLRWLSSNQNSDGGWGDTVLSRSNLSTTLLAWSSVWAVCDRPGGHRPPLQTLERAEYWLRAQIGDLSPENLRRKVIERYGKDRTFSAPILTVLALSGKLGSGVEAWRRVPQLPFEFAACPHQWFRRLRLPVVSYALPALVAIGQSRHHHAPARNPLFAMIRSSLRARTLRIARDMQPASGGFLEATPLTAFVVMNLIGAGKPKDPIVERGVRFLVNSARPDGSWPIDTNLATWVTTLSVNALGGGEQQTVDWLLAQQVKKEHPFTHAQPGGWAWTDLTGGVPDADDTAGALLAICKIAGSKHLDAAIAGIEWLLNIQNRDGGIPTFCRGWGALPFDRSAPDLTAHALEAWSAWHAVLPSNLQQRVRNSAERAVRYLIRQQHTDGSWNPLWFGNENAPNEYNPSYGTARVVRGLFSSLACEFAITADSRLRGIQWLLGAQNPDGGWGGAHGVQSSIEETGMALRALAGIPDASQAISRGVQWLVVTTQEGRVTPPSPIGLYFARLWYFEELYPLIFALAGLTCSGGR